MKTTFLKTGISIMIAAAMLASCKKGGSYSTVLSSAQLSMGVNADNAATSLATTNNTGTPAASSTGSAASSINFTSAIANISGFKFEATRKGLQIDVRSNNLSTVDLFAINPSMTGITLDTGTYTEIEIRVEFSKSSTSTLPLVLKGTFTTSTGTAIPIEFDLNDNAEVSAAAHDVVVDGKTNLTSIVTMHLGKLLAGISSADIAAATQTNGTIIISSTSNQSIYNRVLSNFSSCGDWDGFEHHDR